MKQEFLSGPQAARYCSVSRGTLWNYIKRGDLRASITPGGHYRIDKRDLEVFMQKRGIHPFGTYQPAGKKILIVDDEPLMQKMIAAALTPRGYLCEAVSDGFAAGLKVMEFKPGLVILDLIMPGMNGFQVCRQIKQNRSMAYIKILAITGYDTPINRSRILAKGADGYLVKPMDLEVLRRMVDTLLKTSEVKKV